MIFKGLEIVQGNQNMTRTTLLYTPLVNNWISSRSASSEYTYTGSSLLVSLDSTDIREDPVRKKINFSNCNLATLEEDGEQIFKENSRKSRFWVRVASNRRSGFPHFTLSVRWLDKIYNSCLSLLYVSSWPLILWKRLFFHNPFIIINNECERKVFLVKEINDIWFFSEFFTDHVYVV